MRQELRSTIDIYLQISIPHYKLACQSDSLGTSKQVLVSIAFLAQMRMSGGFGAALHA